MYIYVYHGLLSLSIPMLFYACMRVYSPALLAAHGVQGLRERERERTWYILGEHSPLRRVLFTYVRIAPTRAWALTAYMPSSSVKTSVVNHSNTEILPQVLFCAGIFLCSLRIPSLYNTQGIIVWLLHMYTPLHADVEVLQYVPGLSFHP